jgi:hypothetical protein
VTRLLVSLFKLARGSLLSVSRNDVEERLRALTRSAREQVGLSESNQSVVIGLGVAMLVAFAYLLGRRKGRRRATVLEVRRG